MVRRYFHKQRELPLPSFLSLLRVTQTLCPKSCDDNTVKSKIVISFATIITLQITVFLPKFVKSLSCVSDEFSSLTSSDYTALFYTVLLSSILIWSSCVSSSASGGGACLVVGAWHCSSHAVIHMRRERWVDLPHALRNRKYGHFTSGAIVRHALFQTDIHSHPMTQRAYNNKHTHTTTHTLHK